MPQLYITLVLALVGAAVSHASFEIMNDFCQLENLKSDEEFVCQLYKVEKKTSPNQELLREKYATYAYYKKVKTFEKLDYDIRHSTVFFSNLIEKLRLDHLTILIDDLKDVKWSLLRNFLNGRIRIIPINVQNLSCKEKDNTEKNGFFSLQESNSKISTILHQCPYATWFLKSLDSGVQMPAESNIFQYQEINNHSLRLYEVYSKQANDLVRFPWGIWNPRDGFFNIDGPRWLRRKDMTNVQIRAATLAVCFIF